MAYFEKAKWPEMDVQQYLHALADHFDEEDRAVRERQIRVWRKMKLYWNSFTNIWFDEVAHDWRIYDYQTELDSNDDQGYYDYNVNVFRAYLESIIAALSVTTPGVACFPDDAENNLDVQTANAGDKIAQLIGKHNDDTFLWIHALYLFCTEGLIAGYNYTKKSKQFGTYEVKKHKEETLQKYMCPECQGQLEDAMFQAQSTGQPPINGVLPFLNSAEELKVQEENEYGPDGEDAELHSLYEEKPNELVCPHCAAQLDPSLEKSPLIVTRLVGVTREFKSRVCMEAYGGLNVKVPNYARTQEECPYLRYSFEVHYSKVIEMFPHLAKEYSSGAIQGLTGISDPYEAWARLSPQYHGEYPMNTSTVNLYWFRPYSYNVLHPEQADKLRKEYPDGVCFAKVNECFAGAENECLDDAWTIAKNPLSDYLHFDPLGLLLTSIQDIISEMISLILQTIEHGITQTFADPRALNFKKYRENEVRPGDVFPASAVGGKNLSEFFHEIKTANLSPEVIPFYNLIQELGQLTSGALPSLFGGQMAGSKTASEYSMSRSQALQRLQTPWKMMLMWWKTMYGKAIPMYIKCVAEDERMVTKNDQGQFINTFIRKAELEGKIGSVEIEGDENIPLTWTQQQEVIMQLLQASNPVLMQALMAPENLPWLKKAIGLVDFKIPGESDRDKQFEEIQQLMESEPIQSGEFDPMTMEPVALPSVEVDPDIDNHQIQAEICRGWLISETGRLARLERPNGYMNVLLHLKQHMMYVQMQMAMAQQANVDPNANPEGQANNESGQNGSVASPKENEDSNGNRVPIH